MKNIFDSRNSSRFGSAIQELHSNFLKIQKKLEKSGLDKLHTW